MMRRLLFTCVLGVVVLSGGFGCSNGGTNGPNANDTRPKLNERPNPVAPGDSGTEPKKGKSGNTPGAQ